MSIAQQEQEKLRQEIDRAALGAALEKDCAQQPGYRDKYWSELSIEEKIERTRDQVKAGQYRAEALERICEEQSTRISILEAALQEHRHQVDDAGRVMLPAPTSLNHVLQGARTGRGRIGRDPRAHYDVPDVPPADPSKVYF